MNRLSGIASLAALCLHLAGPVSAQSFRGETATPSALIAFGGSVAVAGGEILIGRPGLLASFPSPPTQPGAVHVFGRSAGGWAQTAVLTASDSATGDGFGAAIAVDGRLLAVGAPKAADGRGAVYLFERRSAGGWTQRARLTPSSALAGEGLGTALALKNGVLLAGAPGSAEDRGRVVVFRQGADAGAWSEQATLDGAGIAAGDRFGAALALSPNRAVIGAPGGQGGHSAQRKPGQAFVFRRLAAGRWASESVLSAGDDSTARMFGAALLFDGADLLVSSPGADSSAGAVFRFRTSSSGWRQVERLTARVPTHPALFGAALARDGRDLLIGAPMGANGTGVIHVLRQDRASGKWTETQNLTMTSVGFGSQLGAALAAAGGIAAAGAPIADFFEGTGRVYQRDPAGGEWREAGAVADTAGEGLDAVVGGEVKCGAGKARAFDCRDADLVAFLPASALGARHGVLINDLWGWTDEETGREFALVGRTDGMAFVEVTDPANPAYLGALPMTEGAHSNIWRDVKVYQNHAFIVADGAGPHGIQVFDLTQLRHVQGAPVVFNETAHYDGIHSAHNIVINERTGYAYAVGNSMGGETCGGALHMVDIREPERPVFAGCYADTVTGKARTGYTHDAQCVTYHGPDTQYQGHEICFNSSETALGIGDVTDKQHPKPISSATYPNVAYAHQGWLSDDHKYFFLDDEGDELAGTTPKTRTLVFDVGDLDDPVVAKEFFGSTAASDHNLYVRGRYMYQSDYVAGLRVVDVADPTNPVEVGYFDTVPFGQNAPGFAGTWSNYPFFRSGVVAVTSMREGLFMIRYTPPPNIP